MSTTCGQESDSYEASRGTFESIVTFLDGQEAGLLEHSALEERLDQDGRVLLRQLFQDHLTVRAGKEIRVEVVDAGGLPRANVEAGHVRSLGTVFGKVNVERLSYRRKGEGNLHPLDGSLNLPEEKHSHGLRRWAAIEASRGSFDAAQEVIERATGQHVGKRQVERLALAGSRDIEDFYEQRCAPASDPGDLLVLSADGKGIVMRPDTLREGTKRSVEASTSKLTSRLSKGEKHGRKRMAELGAVYDAAPVVRTVSDIFGGPDTERVEGPTAKNKWLTASVVFDAAKVIGEVFDEAERRDPTHDRTWVALVGGNRHQIDRIEVEAKLRKVEVTIVIDLIHVLEYIWKAAWCFFVEGDPTAEEWVRTRATRILEGEALNVAAGIRRRASRQGLVVSARKGADACVSYLTGKSVYLDYPTALKQG